MNRLKNLIIYLLLLVGGISCEMRHPSNMPEISIDNNVRKYTILISNIVPGSSLTLLRKESVLCGFGIEEDYEYKDVIKLTEDPMILEYELSENNIVANVSISIIYNNYLIENDVGLVVNKYTQDISALGEPIFIAHALGSVDGYTYTNSKEALLDNYSNGMKFFECDLRLTKDDHVVLYHDTDMLDKFGIEGDVSLLTLEQFLDQRYYGTYHPLSFEDICGLMSSDLPDMYLVLDIKDSNDLIVPKIVDIARNYNIIDRVIPQVHSYNIGVIYKWYDFPIKIWRDYSQDMLELSSMHGINLYSRSIYLPSLISEANEYNIRILNYTVNDTILINNLINDGIIGVYTDINIQ